jgi:hypothetical protein
VSTKIYNAFRVTRGPAELFDFHRAVVRTIEETYTQLYLRLAVSLAVATIDEHWIAAHVPGAPNSHPLSEIVPERSAPRHLLLLDTTRAMDRLGKFVVNSPHRFPGLDLSCEISYLVDDQDHTCFYLKVFSEAKEYVTAVASLERVEDFSYWNNTDRPEGLSKDLWQRRADTWDRLLPGFAAPAERGLSYSTSYILAPSFAALFDRRDLSEFIPSRDERARAHALDPELLPLVTSGDLFDPTTLLGTSSTEPPASSHSN